MEALEGWGAQLQAAHEAVVGELRSKWREASEGPSPLEAVNAFVAAVDWTVRRPLRPLRRWSWGGVRRGCPSCVHPPRPPSHLSPRAQERWIQGLLAAHALLLVAVLVGRRSWGLQSAVFVLCSECSTRESAWRGGNAAAAGAAAVRGAFVLPPAVSAVAPGGGCAHHSLSTRPPALLPPPPPPAPLSGAHLRCGAAERPGARPLARVLGAGLL